MLRYFRINDPYRLIALLVLLTLASLPFLISMPSVTLQELKNMVVGEEIGSKLLYVELIDRTPPMMVMMDGLLNFLFGRSLMARHILALFIIFFQASYFGILLINNKAYNESSYVPALIFGFLCFFSFDLLATTPELFASTLLLLALNNLFKEIEFRVDRDSIVLNLGVFLGIASLFIFSYTVFLFGSIFILIVFARASARKILLMLFGYALVHGILFTIYYCYDQTAALWTNFYVANLTQDTESLVGVGSVFILGLVPLSYFIFSLFMLTREAHFTKYQSQLFQVIFLWLAIAFISIWLTPERTPHSYYACLPATAYFISHYLLLIRRKLIAEFMFWILIAGLLSINLLSRYHVLESVNYSKLFPTTSPYENKVYDKKIMVLGNDPSLFQHNHLAGYFLDWELSRKYFEAPDIYENVIKVNQSLLQELPDLIIDENGLMGPFEQRIPAIGKQYRKEKNIYWKR